MNEDEDIDRAYVFGIMMACPYATDNSDESCPLCTYREVLKDNDKKLDFVEKLTVDEINKFLKLHFKCSKKKENKIIYY